MTNGLGFLEKNDIFNNGSSGVLILSGRLKIPHPCAPTPRAFLPAFLTVPDSEESAHKAPTGLRAAGRSRENRGGEGRRRMPDTAAEHDPPQPRARRHLHRRRVSHEAAPPRAPFAATEVRGRVVRGSLDSCGPLVIHLLAIA
jgi:hypothetical protein